MENLDATNTMENRCWASTTTVACARIQKNMTFET